MKNLDQSISFFIIPFTMGRSVEKTVLGIDDFQLPQGSIWKLINMRNEGDVFFSHIQNFLLQSVSGNEGEQNKIKSSDLFIYSIVDKDWGQIFGNQSIYEMEKDGRKAEFFFPNFTPTFESPKLIVYPDASVGILMIPIEMKRSEDGAGDNVNNFNPMSMEDLMDFNYCIHKIDNQKPRLVYQIPKNLKEEYRHHFFDKMEKVSKTLGVAYEKQKEEPLSFDLLKLAEKLLSLMGTNYEFTNKKRCHVLTYMHSNSDEELTPEEKGDLLRISRCENKKYQIIENDKAILQTFKNIYLLVSVEGSALMTNGNLQFLLDFKTDTFQKRYLWLYLLAIIQRYSLINMSKAIGEIDDTNDKQKTVSLRRLRDLSDRLVRIKVNTCFSDVSDYKQHNDFYHFCIRKLGVTRLLHDLEQKMATLGECLKQKADKRSENMQLLLAIFVAFLTVFSGCNDGFEFFKNLLNVGDNPNPIWLICIYKVIFTLVFGFSILMIWRYRKELWEIISDILHFWKKHH